MKKGLSFILIVMVIMLCLVPTAFAAGTTVSVSEAACEVGETVTVNVSINGNTGFKAYDIALNYDSEQLELVSIAKGAKSEDGMFTSKVETGKAAFAGSDAVEGDGVLFTAEFKALKDGIANVGVTVNKLGISTNEQVTPAVQGGSVTVKAEEVDDPNPPVVDPEDPTVDPGDGKDDLDDVPKTGDAENVALYVVLAIAAAAVVSILAARKAFSK